MAKPGADEPVGMDRAGLKRMLKLARKGPVHAAFALGKDGKPVMVLNKRKQPRALEKQIKSGLPDSKNHRFGSVFVDPDEPKLARFVVNKAASGMARKLVLGLKGTGCNRVQIVLEDGTPVDAAEGEEEEILDEAEEGEDYDDADEEYGAEADAEAEEYEPPAETAPEDAEAPAEAAPDAGTLTRMLTMLVKRMLPVIQADPDRKEELQALAVAAQACLKAGDLEAANTNTDLLLRALDQTVDEAPADEAGEEEPYVADDVEITGTTSPDTPQWEAGPSFDPADDTSGQAAADTAGDAEPAPPAADPAALAATLTDLVKQLMPLIAADPSQRDVLKGLITQAQASLKDGDLDRADGHVAGLRSMLANASSPAPGTASHPDAPALAKARKAWLATRTRVEGEIGKLHDGFAAAFRGHSMEGDLTKAFRTRVDTVLDALDDALAHKLDAVNQATDAAQRAQLVQEAKSLVQRYQAHIAADPTIAALDRNPFVPVTIQKTMVATLAALEKTIR